MRGGLLRAEHTGQRMERAALFDKNQVTAVQKCLHNRQARERLGRKQIDTGTTGAALFHKEWVGGRIFAGAAGANHGHLDGRAVGLAVNFRHGHIAAVGQRGHGIRNFERITGNFFPGLAKGTRQFSRHTFRGRGQLEGAAVGHRIQVEEAVFKEEV